MISGPLHILEDAADVAEVRIARSTVRRGRTTGFSRAAVYRIG